jgi:hypothetical protein
MLIVLFTNKFLLRELSIIFPFYPYFHRTEMATKVLVAGDVEGNLPALFKRVEAVNKKVR